MNCQIQWIDCDGRSTAHDAQAVAYAVHKGKRYPICAAHLETLKGRRSHHSPDCPHLGGFYFAGLWDVEPLVDPDLAKRYRFFVEHAGYCSPPGRVACALALAKAEQAAERRGLKVQWEEECMPWDGDCPPPKVHLMASIYHPDRSPTARLGDAHYFVLAHLGSIGLDSWRDPYMRVVAAELFSEALGVLDDEDSEKAETLAQRATYAGVF